MTDHEQPAAGVALKPCPGFNPDLSSRGEGDCLNCGRHQSEHGAPTDAGGAVSEADPYGPLDNSLIVPQPLQQGGEVTREIEERLKGILIEESPMHPFGCATWEEESRIAIDMAIDSLRSLAADRDKAVGLLRGLKYERKREGVRLCHLKRAVAVAWSEVLSGHTEGS